MQTLLIQLASLAGYVLLACFAILFAKIGIDQIRGTKRNHRRDRLTDIASRLKFVSTHRALGRHQVVAHPHLRGLGVAFEDVALRAELLDDRAWQRVLEISGPALDLATKIERHQIAIPEPVNASLIQSIDEVEAISEKAKRSLEADILTSFDTRMIDDSLAAIGAPRDRDLGLHSSLTALAPELAIELRKAKGKAAPNSAIFAELALKLDRISKIEGELDANTRRYARSVTWSFLEAVRELRSRHGKVDAEALPDLQKLEQFYTLVESRGKTRSSEAFKEAVWALSAQVEGHITD